MCTIITTVITVIACFITYSYVKKKYGSELEKLQEIISGLNLDLIKSRTESRELETKLFVKDREVSSYKTRLENIIEINKELSARKNVAPVEPTAEEPKKKGRKPGTKRPYFKKKPGSSSGN